MTKPAGIASADIQEFIDHLLKSGVSNTSERRVTLLKYILETELEGRGDTIKAYSLGIDFFGQPDTFDASAKSTVRVEMGRVRNMLTLFEASDFATCRIVVEIPVGSYRPKITLREPSIHPTEEDVDERTSKSSWRLPRPALAAVAIGLLIVVLVAVLPMGRSSLQHIGLQIVAEETESATSRATTEALAAVLTKTTTIKLYETGTRWWFRQPEALFQIQVQALDQTDNQRLSVKLTNTETREILWAYDRSVDQNESVSRLVREELVPELRVRIFGAAKQVLESRDPDTLSPEELFIMATWVPGVHESHLEWEQRTIKLAGAAIERDPSYGAAHSVLADKLAYVANMHAPLDTPENRAASVFHSQRAMQLSPLDPDVVFNVSLAHWHNGRLSESIELTNRVIELDPGHDVARYLALVSPYTCSAAPREVLDQAIAFDDRLAVDNPIRWVTLNWIGWLHAYRGELEEGLVAEEAAARIFQMPYTFMRRAMILSELDRADESCDVINSQIKSWPGFDPSHFATTTIPTLCSEAGAEGQQFIDMYKRLSEKLDARQCISSAVE